MYVTSKFPLSVATHTCITGTTKLATTDRHKYVAVNHRVEPLLFCQENMIKETDPSKEQTSQLTYALSESAYTAKFQGSIPEIIAHNGKFKYVEKLIFNTKAESQYHNAKYPPKTLHQESEMRA